MQTRIAYGKVVLGFCLFVVIGPGLFAFSHWARQFAESPKMTTDPTPPNIPSLEEQTALAFGPGSDSQRSSAADPAEEPLGSAKVSLVLLKASAERDEIGVFFDCDVRLDNATGKDLTVKSNFADTFDGLELVITDKKGKTLAQWGHTWHMSPFAKPQDCVLKQGSTTATLRFPVPNILPKDVKTVKVRLVGILTRSTYTNILSTETLEIEIKE